MTCYNVTFSLIVAVQPNPRKFSAEISVIGHLNGNAALFIAVLSDPESINPHISFISDMPLIRFGNINVTGL